jgi:hypothetical protein
MNKLDEAESEKKESENGKNGQVLQVVQREAQLEEVGSNEDGEEE